MINLSDYGLRAQRPDAIDSSMLKDFVDCPSLFYLRHVLGLRRRTVDPQRQSPLDWGTVWHRVMHAWRTTHDSVKALEQLEPWPNTIMAESDRHARSKERMAKIFFDYVEKFAADDERDFEFLRSEQFFDVSDEEIGLRWTGRIDGVNLRKRNKKLVLPDFKTTSAMGQWFFEMHEHGFQLPGYVWATSHMMTQPIEEVMLDVLYTLKTEHKFFRRTLRYPVERIAEWHRNVLMWMTQLNHLLDNDLENPEAWAKNWNSCTRYGICSFADVHFLPPTGDTRLRVLGSDYMEDRWSPLNEAGDV